ncbi:MAG TPA: hypothetical protein VJR25_08125 [Microbacterium sp.]|uniref:hypothetical protein n=1 Tax=Microbacterium sp. TaxID=51671 RepID=UPI002B48BD39|nr:hypothetical protein [Microbacterium sp.]HKT56724.1 hypothetical protein [Microbacterium sp.]
MASASAPSRRERFPESYAIFDRLVAEYSERPDVALGRMFASEGLSVRGKVFAFVGFSGSLFAKLPEQRVGELIEAGDASPAVMRGRPMREWVTLDPSRPDTWDPIVAEAHAFVDSITPAS